MMQQKTSTSYLFGGNAPYVEELYEAYLENPGSVPDNWRQYFDAMQNVPAVDGTNKPDVIHSSVIASFAERAKAGPIRTMKEALDEPEVRRRGMLKTYKHSRVGEVPIIGSNYHFSDTPVDDTRPPPSLGEHTSEVLSRIAGLGEAEITALRGKKIIG